MKFKRRKNIILKESFKQKEIYQDGGDFTEYT